MSNQLSHSDIPTTWLFGKRRGFSWNPVRGCANYSCLLHPENKGKCWAAQLCRFHGGPWAKSDYFHNPMDGLYDKSIMIKIRKDALKKFEPFWFQSQFDKQFPKEQACIAVGYQTDLAFVPQEWVNRILEKIKENNRERVAAGLPLHVFQFLTKAPGKLYPYFEWPLNCWLGFTAMNQSKFNENISAIHDSFTTTSKEGISALNALFYVYLEPLESEIKIDMTPGIFEKNWIKWVIVGGGDEPLNPEWVRSIRDQCQAAGISFFFKGWGEMIELEGAFLRKRDINALNRHRRKNNLNEIPKNVIDSMVWEQFPEVKS